jgi:hypothetical protein
MAFQELKLYEDVVNNIVRTPEVVRTDTVA